MNRFLVLLLILIVVYIIYQITKCPVLDKNVNIGIIGCGPSGILAAKNLNDKGYYNITMYGSYSDNQCNTLKIGEIYADTCACFMHAGYNNSVAKLCHQYGFETREVISKIKQIDGNKSNTVNQIKFAFFSILAFFFKNHTDIFNCTAEEFAKRYNLIWPEENTFVHGQLYGYNDKVTAYHLFDWYSPRSLWPIFINAKTALKINDDEKIFLNTVVINKGYGNLFLKIFNDLTITAHHETYIKTVEKSKVVTIDDVHYEHDLIIVACPPNNRLETPLTALLESDDIDCTYVFAIIWGSEHKPFDETVHYYPAPITSKQYNRIISHRYFGKDLDHIQQGCGYTTANSTVEDLLIQLKEQIGETTAIYYFKKFKYNHRFSVDALNAGVHRKAFELNGKDNIWYSSGPFTHWDIDSIHEYTERLVPQILSTRS